MSDILQRFVFENTDIRGHVVQLDQAYAELLAQHAYAPGVSRLLGEFLAAVALLGTTLKFQGVLTLQARSAGQVPLMMTEVTSDFAVRGIARGAEQATAEGFDELIGGGTLAITIDPEQGARYQGVAPLEHDSLAACLGNFFDQSEQLPSRFWLASDGRRAAGFMLQALPAQLVTEPGERDNQWQHLVQLADTLTPGELLELPVETILHRLYHQEDVRLFPVQPLRFQCSCSRERSARALVALGRQEVEQVIDEQGDVRVQCEFCGGEYRFLRQDLDALFPSGGGSLH